MNNQVEQAQVNVEQEAQLLQHHFNLQEFNSMFAENKIKDKEIEKKIEAEKIAALNHVETKSILDMSMLEILTGVKDTWIEIIVDCVNFKFNYKNLLYDGKLFYIGVSIVIIFMIVYISDNLFYEQTTF